MKTLVAALAALIALVTLAPTADAQATVVYRTYDVVWDSLGVPTPQSGNEAAHAVITDVFASYGYPAPAVGAGEGAEPSIVSTDRLYEIHALRADDSFAYVEVHEANASGSGYLDWSRSYRDATGPTEGEWDEGMRLAAMHLLVDLGYATDGEQPPDPSTFFIWGANPSTTGRLRANVPQGYAVTWVDALGREIGTGAEVNGLAAGVYFAVAVRLSTRDRQVARATVL